MRKTRTPKSNCPTCEAPITCATGATHDAQPTEGDLSVCLHCGCYLTFTQDLRVRRLNAYEFRKLPKENREELIRARTAVREAKQKTAH